jgi:hypothetical protein
MAASGAMLAALVGVAAPAVAGEARAYTLEVRDVTAKVGEEAVLLARLRLNDGYRVLHAYNNRVGQLSSFDDGVAFERRAVAGNDEDGTLVFEIGVRPTRPGPHPINGVVRFGYVEGSDGLAMISVPLIATVVGTD